MGHGSWTASFFGETALHRLGEDALPLDTVLSAFIAELRATPAECDMARSAVRAVADRLDADLHAHDAPPRSEPFRLLGGFDCATAIRPGRPVDMLYILPDGFRSDIRPGPAETAAIERRILAALGDWARYDRPADPFWITAVSPGGVPVQFAPAIRTVTGQYATPPLRPDGSWRTIDPAAERAALFDADHAARGMATPLIMMLKAWRRTRGVAVRPFALRLLVCEFFRDRRPRSAVDLADAFCAFLRWSAHPRVGTLLTPAAFSHVRIGRDWPNKALAAADLFDAARRLYDFGVAAPAFHRWHTLFGPRFPAQHALAAVERRLVGVRVNSR